MGGNKQQSRTNQMIDQDRNRQNAEHAQDRGRNEADLNASRQSGDQLYGDLYSGFSSLAKEGWNDGRGSSTGGGSATFQAPPVDPRFGDVEKTYREFMDTGGVSEE